MSERAIITGYALADMDERRKLEAEVERLRGRLAEINAALDDFRDTVLNERGAIAENGMTNDQINDVLGEFDDRFPVSVDEVRQAIAEIGGEG